jgi:hypothetical protein
MKKLKAKPVRVDINQAIESDVYSTMQNAGWVWPFEQDDFCAMTNRGQENRYSVWIDFLPILLEMSICKCLNYYSLFRSCLRFDENYFCRRTRS